MEDVCHNKRIKSRKLKHVTFLPHKPVLTLSALLRGNKDYFSFLFLNLEPFKYLPIFDKCKKLGWRAKKQKEADWLDGAEATSVTLYSTDHTFNFILFTTANFHFHFNFIHQGSKSPLNLSNCMFLILITGSELDRITIHIHPNLP